MTPYSSISSAEYNSTIAGSAQGAGVRQHEKTKEDQLQVGDDEEQGLQS